MLIYEYCEWVFDRDGVCIPWAGRRWGLVRVERPVGLARPVPARIEVDSILMQLKK